MKLLNWIRYKYLNIKSWIFPYYPTEQDVKDFYNNGNGFFDRMSDQEKIDFLKKDKDLPLGL